MEKETGLDFFAELPRDLQGKLEFETASAMWCGWATLDWSESAPILLRDRRLLPKVACGVKRPIGVTQEFAPQ